MRLSNVHQSMMAKRVAMRYLRALNQIDLYHGTGFKNLKSISKKGLVADSGAVWSGGFATALTKDQKAVYLTSDFELAARYARGSQKQFTPIVLEVRISSPRRFRKLKYDPLDRHDTSWKIEESYDDDADQTTRDIEKGAEDIARLLGYEGYRGWLNLPLPEDIEELDGINVYKLVVGNLVKLLGLNRMQRKQAMRMVQEKFDGDRWEYIEVRKDGTLKLTEEYFYTREQLMYMKGLPPSTIKGVWLRQSDFDIPESQIKETRSGGFKELPGESAVRYEDLKDIMGRLRYTEPAEMDDLEGTAEQVRSLDYDELADYLDEVAGMDPEDRPEMDEWDEEMEGFEMGLDDDWGEERIQDEGTWVKVPLQTAARLKPREGARAAA